MDCNNMEQAPRTMDATSEQQERLPPITKLSLRPTGEQLAPC